MPQDNNVQLAATDPAGTVPRKAGGAARNARWKDL